MSIQDEIYESCAVCGGDHDLELRENLQTLCRSCNSKKGNKIDYQAQTNKKLHDHSE